MKKIYKNVVQVVILSDEPLETKDITNLDNVSYEIHDGGWSGRVKPVLQNHTFTGKEAIEVIEEQGTDPEFFNLDVDGHELETEDWVDPAGGTHDGNEDDPAGGTHDGNEDDPAQMYE